MKLLSKFLAHLKRYKFLYLLALICFYPLFFLYRADYFVAGVDTFPLFNLSRWLSLIQYLWGNNEFFGSALGAPTSSAAISPHFLINSGLDYLGTSNSLRSILLLVFFNLAAAFALYFFIGCISKKVNPEFRFIGAVFYILNNYLLLYFGAYVTGWLLLSLPLLLGLLLKIIQSEPKQQRFFILLFGLAFFTTAPTSANPPTLFMLIGALLVFS
jgi:hypothetical protein